MTEYNRVVFAISIAAQAAVEWHYECRPRRLRRAQAWSRMVSVYGAAARCPAHRDRAEALGLASEQRAMAWQALPRWTPRARCIIARRRGAGGWRIRSLGRASGGAAHERRSGAV